MGVSCNWIVFFNKKKVEKFVYEVIKSEGASLEENNMLIQNILDEA